MARVRAAPLLADFSANGAPVRKWQESCRAATETFSFSTADSTVGFIHWAPRHLIASSRGCGGTESTVQIGSRPLAVV